MVGKGRVRMKLNPVIVFMIVIIMVMISGCVQAQSNPPVSNENVSSPIVPLLESPTVNRTEASGKSDVEQEDGFLGVRMYDKSGDRVREWTLDKAYMMQLIWKGVGESADEALLVYSSSKPEVSVQLLDGNRIALEQPKWVEVEDGYGNDYGSDVLYADRIVDDQIFAVKGNRTLYQVNIKTGQTKKLRVMTNAVYGIAASPDNRKVALLTATEKELGTSADLSVMDANGKLLYTKKQASYISHSDGFLFVYPMAWADSRTVVVPYYNAVPFLESNYVGSAWSKAYVDIEQDTSMIRNLAPLPKEALDLLEEQVGEIEYTGSIRSLPRSLDEENHYYAIESDERETWLIDIDKNRVIKLGWRSLVKWTRAGELVVWKPNLQDYFYNIGLHNVNLDTVDIKEN